jgi:hypothetical protein
VSKDQPNENPHEERKDNIKPFMRRKVRTAAEVVAGYVCYTFGDDLTGWGYSVAGWFFHYLVLCSAAFLLADIISDKWTKKVCIVVGISCAFLFGLYCWLAPGPTKQEPHLQFGLAISPTRFVWLTNNCLMPMKSPGNEGWIWHMNLSNEMAWLVVPLQTNQSNIEFTPLLENNSKVQADSALVEILIGGNIKYTANEEWSVVKDQTSNTSFIWKGAFVRAGASFALPPLNLTFPLDSTQKWGPSRALSITHKYMAVG